MEARRFSYPTVDSTNERALAALADGSARDGNLHVAAEQTAGRGRRGRRWESAPGTGLYWTRVFRPAPPGPPAPAITMAAGVALIELLIAHRYDGLRLDWPNDVVAGTRKLAGILVESRTLPHYAIGIGLNVGQRSFPAELRAEREVTSLGLVDPERDPPAAAALVEPLAEELERWLRRASEAPAELIGRYLEHARLMQATVRIEAPAFTGTATLLGLDLEEGLDLLEAGGGRLRVPLAHVRRLEPAGPAS